jgi:zinc transport system substrate-binding protein
MRSHLRRTLAAAGALALLATAAACGGGADADTGGRPSVVAAFYPLQFVAERVGGDRVAVSTLAKPGAEPHDLELNPRQVGEVSDARLVVYLSGFQPAVDDAVGEVGGDRAFDVTTAVPLLDASDAGHSHEEGADEGAEEGHEEEAGGTDPHVWLDPVRLATIAEKVAERLAAADPDGATTYAANAAALRSQLEGLDRELADGLRTCQRREIVTSHAAFGYLADRYDLEQIGLSGLTPEEEPSPQRLARVAAEAREHGATTIFFETLVSPKVAETIAQEVGAQTAVLDPVEGLQPGATGDYLSVMRANLAALRTALGCT